MKEFPRLQTASEDMCCGPCSDILLAGDEYYWHSTGMIECVPCHRE